METSTTSTVKMEQWDIPVFVSAKEVGETIEMIYKQTEKFTTRVMSGGIPDYQTRAVKIIFSCLDGKWNKSEPIYGTVQQAQEELCLF